MILDERDRILLVQIRDPTTDRHWWCTPGGGVDPGESWEQAARRELFEETGLADVGLGPLIWTREHRGTFMGKAFHAVERLFLVRVAAFEPTSDGDTDLERRVHVEMRWWTLEEMERKHPPFAPARLPTLVRDLLSTGVPPVPIDAGT